MRQFAISDDGPFRLPGGFRSNGLSLRCSLRRHASLYGVSGALLGSGSMLICQRDGERVRFETLVASKITVAWVGQYKEWP